MFNPEGGILQLMSQVSTLPPITHEDAMIYSTDKYPSLSRYFINAMHENKKLVDLERYSHTKSSILAKFLKDSDSVYLTKSFSLGEKKIKDFVLSVITNPDERAKDLPFFFYVIFEDDINGVWKAAKEKFDIDTHKGDDHAE